MKFKGGTTGFCLRSTDTLHTSVLPDVQPTAVCSLSSIRAESGRGFWFGISCWCRGAAQLHVSRLSAAQVQTDRCRNLQVTCTHARLLLTGRPPPSTSTSTKTSWFWFWCWSRLVEVVRQRLWDSLSLVMSLVFNKVFTSLKSDLILLHASTWTWCKYLCVKHPEPIVCRVLVV